MPNEHRYHVALAAAQRLIGELDADLSMPPAKRLSVATYAVLNAIYTAEERVRVASLTLALPAASDPAVSRRNRLALGGNHE